MKGFCLLLLCLSLCCCETLAFLHRSAAAAAKAAAARAAVSGAAASSASPAAASSATPAAAASATPAAAADTPMRRAALFPGQGAQCIGMGVTAAETHAPSLSLFSRASSVLGFDLLKACREGPKDFLNKTNIAQPALLTASLAAYSKWRDTTDDAVPFDVCGGLSLGEFTALTFAGVLSFESAVSLVSKRGQLMQAAAEQTPGRMFAVLGLSQQQTQQVCAAAAAAAAAAGGAAAAAPYCGIANYLCKGNYAVSVSAEAAAALEAAAAAAAAKRCIPLQVAGAFHSPLMAAAAAGLQEAVAAAEFKRPQVPIVLNVDAAMHSDPEVIKHKLLQQLTSPVQWEQSMSLLGTKGLEEAFEFGPGGVLTGLMKKINPNVKMLRVE